MSKSNCANLLYKSIFIGQSFLQANHIHKMGARHVRLRPRFASSYRCAHSASLRTIARSLKDHLGQIRQALVAKVYWRFVGLHGENL